jgi:uracil-DNA glycosylase
MRISDYVGCKNFPCPDVNRSSYIIPGVEVEAKTISIVLISESAPENLADYYYATGAAPSTPIFAETTLLAFNDAGVKVNSVQELIQRGIYLTSAVKCGKTTYNIQTGTITECSRLLERELSLFPNVKAYLLMGDVAIKGINSIARRNGEPRPVAAGSTYKIRGNEFFFRGKRVFPSYLQAGPSFFIEKSKRRMIAEDISAAMELVQS